MQSNFNTKLKPQTGFLILSIYFALVLSTMLVFWQVRNFDFVNYDDDLYVYENQHILNGLTPDGIIWAFTTPNTGNWHPLTWLSLMLDCQLFGPNPGWPLTEADIKRDVSRILGESFCCNCTGFIRRPAC